MYGTYTDYVALFGDGGLQEVDYRRHGLKADRLMDAYTTTIDGVKKLKDYYPTNAEDAELVSLCHCEIVNLLWQIQVAENAAQDMRGVVVTDAGVHGKAISSMSAGNESVSFGSASSSGTTAIDKAVADKAEQKRQIAELVRTFLSSVPDANGVNLLYAGRYPVCLGTS